MDDSFLFINNEQSLANICQEMTKEPALAVDIECENNLHHYGVKIALIQISTKKHNFIIDPLSIKDFSALKTVFENPKVEKIFHDTGFDLRMLGYQYKIFTRNIFDTQVAAALLGKTELGLGNLLQEYFSIKKESKMQRADWTKRPLTMDMLNYATKDTSYLLELSEKLKNELKAKQRLEWAYQETKHVEERKLIYKQPGFWDLKGLKNLSDQERAILKRWYVLRNFLAKKVDRPIHFVISNKLLFEFAHNPPRDWNKVKGIHPIVKKNSKRFQIELTAGRKEHLKLPLKKSMRHTAVQQQAIIRLLDKRDAVAEKLGIPAPVIIGKDDAAAVIRKELKLRPWQEKLLF